MHELNNGNAGTGEVVEASGNILTRVVRYTVVIAEMAVAGIRLHGLSERVKDTYHYVEGCAASTDRLAEQMARLTVDVDTIAEHHGAAAVMRGVLADAEAMAEGVADLAVLFEETSAAHQADYGPVAEAANAMDVPMADAEFYSNR